MGYDNKKSYNQYNKDYGERKNYTNKNKQNYGDIVLANKNGSYVARMWKIPDIAIEEFKKQQQETSIDFDNVPTGGGADAE